MVRVVQGINVVAANGNVVNVMCAETPNLGNSIVQTQVVFMTCLVWLLHLIVWAVFVRLPVSAVREVLLKYGSKIVATCAVGGSPTRVLM